MFSEINVCSDITKEFEIADTVSDTALVGIRIESKQNKSEVLEKENEDEIEFNSDDIRSSTGYLNAEDCNEYKSEGTISSEGNNVETDTGN